ncbi:MAG: hypothetical protein GWN18_04500, partial [Thermoplasmata archaeon]|nr:hypothetical protein [Thermoplasmata archaeon]NIT76296.1 hypothetical protein [Thermoplasmata archaeon]NIU48363.1 hypothetical protein [Thermoplasmata archaeon]NIV77990.1 hypothetical protein [Thermoplasmata archaeon]NIW81839.1 hypothetical protein [Thermoplasmata archaeon]
MEEVFKIEPAEVVGEPAFPGTIVRRRTGEEFRVSGKRENWGKNRYRKRFYGARDACIRKA